MSNTLMPCRPDTFISFHPTHCNLGREIKGSPRYGSHYFRITSMIHFHLLDCLLFQYMLTHGTKRAEIDFMVLLTIFEYAESNAEWCQAQLFMQRLEFYDLKSASKIARKSLRNKDFSQYKAYVCLLYM